MLAMTKGNPGNTLTANIILPYITSSEYLEYARTIDVIPSKTNYPPSPY